MSRMTMKMGLRVVVLALAVTAVSAQYSPGGRFGPGRNNDDDDDDDFSRGRGQRNRYSSSFISSRHTLLLAHGILASLAFILLFPLGAILIRLLPSRHAHLIHGAFQLLAYTIYVAAFGIGVWMVNNMPVNLLDHYHPIIGIVVFVLLFFQPILGVLHHWKFKKYSRRTVWSYAHLWLGRVVITLGMINGGLGLLLASDAPAFTGFAPSTRYIIAYGIIAGVMWVLWVAAAVYGERKRHVSRKALESKEVEMDKGPATPPAYKGIYAYRAYA